MMKPLRSALFLISCSVFFIFLDGCIQDISVEIPPHTSLPSDSRLARIHPRKICLKAIKDVRILDRAEGTREAAFGVPMGSVDFYPSVESIFKDVIKAEFQSAGHTLVKEEQPITLAGEILTFEVRTDTTPLYWDIIGRTLVELQIKSADGKASKHTYSSIFKERTYIYPSGTLIQKVMKSCINDFANQLRNDAKLAQALM